MGEIFMSSKEVDRYTIMKEVSKGKLKLVQAAPLLNLSYRQTKRLWKRFLESGKKGLISLKRGRLSNLFESFRRICKKCSSVTRARSLNK
jgi:hypothetical protein